MTHTPQPAESLGDADDVISMPGIHDEQCGESTDRVKTLFITRDFPPVSHSGTLRSEAFARYLPDYGVDPVILTSQPQDRSSTKGLDQTTREAWQDDPRWPAVYRVPWNTPPSQHFDRLAPRIPVLASLSSQRRRWSSAEVLMETAREAASRHAVSAVYATFNPSEPLMLAVLLAEELDLPAIADIRDPWSYHPVPPYRHVADFWLERRLERRVLHRCSRVVVNTESCQQLLEQKLKVPPEKIRLIRNGYDETNFEDSPQSQTPLEPGKFVILHAGQLADGNLHDVRLKDHIKRRFGFDYDPLEVDFTTRSPRYLVSALNLLFTRYPELADKIRVWLVGMNDPEQSRSLQELRHSECLQVMPRVDPRTAAEYVRRADLLLLMQFRYLLKGRDCCMAIPAKLYDYLRSGSRILACVQPSETGELIEQHRAGTVVDPTDVTAIAEGVLSEYQRWRDDQSRLPTVPNDIERFSRRSTSQQLAETIRELV